MEKTPKVNLAEFMMNSMEKYGTAVALIEAKSKVQYTYKECIDRIQRLAAGLQSLGMRQGDVLCALTFNNIQYPIFWYATNMLGATFSTASPYFTDDELERRFKDCKTKFLITIPSLSSRVIKVLQNCAHNLFKIIVLGKAEGFISYDDLFCYGKVVRPTDVDPETSTAILLSSSGTSGQPKHVQLTHVNISVNILQHQEMLQLRQGETTVLALPVFHYFGVHGALGNGLYHGLRIVTMETWDTLGYMSLVQEYKANVLQLVPAMIGSIVKHPDRFKFDFSNVRFINTASAPLGLRVADELKALFKQTFIGQAYGSTETGFNSGNTEQHYRPGSCGVRPSGVDLKIVDVDTGEDVSRSQPGEVVVRGPSVTIGYLNNPAANDADRNKYGYFRTGDVGYIDDDGFLFIVDRMKELIKFKGFQVAPAYLEDLLVKHKDIVEAAVVGIPDDDAGELPKAFVVKKKESSLSVQDVITYVTEHVAPHMRLRGGVEFLDQLPRNPSGKLLRRVLKSRATSKM